jgi:Protein of unknown function (DUF3300)
MDSIRKPNARALTAIVSALLLLVTGKLSAQQIPPSEPDSTQYPGPASGYQQPYRDSAQFTHQPLGADQLEQLVAPIALYPDPLVAQVLAAATYPGQVQEADQWRRAQYGGPAEEIAWGADAQPWDPSVKALTAFPQVLAQMDRNLQWTTDLGTAYYNQPQDVLEAVQVMRGRAQAAGNLRSTPQEVVRYDEGNIVLAPADPQVVYVPAYNPWAVYGEPVSPYPGFSLLGAAADFFTSSIRYGLGIGLSAFAHTPWGWLAWGLNWLAQSVLFGGSAYYSHSGTVADWGFSHYGHHADWGRAGFERGHEFGRRQGQSWRHGGGLNHGGWHDFSRARDWRVANSGGGYGRGFQSFRGQGYGHGFHRFREERGSMASYGSRSIGGMPNGGGGYQYALHRGGAFDQGGQRFRGGESYRASTGGFPRGELGHSSVGFARTSGKSHSGGFDLFGGGRSEKGFGGGGAGFRGGGFNGGRFHGGGGGQAPKFHGGGGFGGGHSHGGGHSGGHGGHGGGHHR